MRELEGNDPRVKAVARQLEITCILRAWEEDGVLFIQDPWDTYEAVSEGYTDTLPEDVSSDVRAVGRQETDELTGLPLDEQGQVLLDDFTAITGVGSVTAQKLHDLELYTYEDLRTWIELRENEATSSQVELVEVLHGISAHTFEQIKEWLEARLV